MSAIYPPETLPEAPSIPHSVEAEQAVLGALLINPDLFPDAESILRPADFYIKRHAWIWEAIAALSKSETAVDYITVTDHLAAKGLLEEAGGGAFLTSLVAAAPSSLNLLSYARIIESHAIRRRMLNSANSIANIAYNEKLPIEQVMSESEKIAAHLADRNNGRDQGLSTISEQLGLQTQELLADIPPRTISTGFRGLDNFLAGGCTPGRFYVIAGRPGQGKTSLLVKLAYNMHYKPTERQRVLFFTEEMKAKEVTDRIVAIHTGINTQRIEKRRMEPGDEWDKYFAATESLATQDFIIDDTPEVTTEHIRMMVRRLQPDIVFIDYLQLLLSGLDRNTTRNDQIGYITRQLKIIAGLYNVPLWCASQLSRDVEKRKTKRPQLSDLRESGSIEQDADVVAFIWHNETTKPTALSPINFSIAKHRGGPVGDVGGLMYRHECALVEQSEDAGFYIGPENDGE